MIQDRSLHHGPKCRIRMTSPTYQIYHQYHLMIRQILEYQMAAAVVVVEVPQNQVVNPMTAMKLILMTLHEDLRNWRNENKVKKNYRVN